MCWCLRPLTEHCTCQGRFGRGGCVAALYWCPAGELRRQLAISAEQLEDLRMPPGNRLEKLSRNRAGQHSIRVKDQWRVCFRWKGGHAYEVEIVGDH